MVREAAEELAKAGQTSAAHRNLVNGIEALLEAFRREHSIIGVRYWEGYCRFSTGRIHFTTFGTKPSIRDVDILQAYDMVELNRTEYLARTGHLFDNDPL